MTRWGRFGGLIEAWEALFKRMEVRTASWMPSLFSGSRDRKIGCTLRMLSRSVSHDDCVSFVHSRMQLQIEPKTAYSGTVRPY